MGIHSLKITTVMFTKHANRIRQTNIVAIQPELRRTNAKLQMRWTAHAPDLWHSCRRRHPAATACSPCDHRKRHTSAPSFRSAHAHVCKYQATVAAQTLIHANTGKRVSAMPMQATHKREQIASTFNFGTRFMLQSYPQNKIARLSPFHKTQTETHIALELLVSPGIQ